MLTALGPAGLDAVTTQQGISYHNFLQANCFAPLKEGSLVTMLENYLQKAQQVMLFGQVYHDGNGAVGIHDIHRITGYLGEHGYADGGFFVNTGSETFAVFLHFKGEY